MDQRRWAVNPSFLRMQKLVFIMAVLTVLFILAAAFFGPKKGDKR